MTPNPEAKVEIVRSFSYKLNAGNYESRDFFYSQKAECLQQNAEAVSKALHDFCRAEVMRDVNAYCAEHGIRRPGKA